MATTTKTRTTVKGPMFVPDKLPERAGGRCEIGLDGCHMGARIVVRRGGSRESIAGTLYACDPCSKWVEANAADARRIGITIGARQDPALTLVAYRGRMSRLSDDGTVTPDDSAKMPTGWRSALPWGSIRYRLRQPLRAWYALAGFMALAGIATSLPWPAVLVLVALGVLAAWFGAPVVLARGRDRDELGERKAAAIQRRRRYVLAVAVVAGIWLLFVAAVGLEGRSTPSRVAWSLLPLLWLWPSVTWWRYVRIRPTVAKPEAGPEPVEEKAPQVTIPARAAELWAEHALIVDTKLLPETYREIAGGWTAVVEATKPGALPAMLDDKTLRTIAGVYRCPRNAISWGDEHKGNPGRALLTIQPDSPLVDPVPWVGLAAIDPKRWTVQIGKAANGGTTSARLWVPGVGAPNRAYIGSTGSGKTEGLRILLTAMLMATIRDANNRSVAAFSLFIHDPKRGRDFAPFRRLVDGFSMSLEELHVVVSALVREMDRRYDMLTSAEWVDARGRKRRGDVAFTPGLHGPILSLTIDEAHEAAKDPKLVPLLEQMARKMRGAGIQINIATHMSNLGDWGTAAYRDMIVGGELGLYRTKYALNAALAGETGAGDPRTLKKWPGMHYWCNGEGASTEARMAWLPADDLYDLLWDENNEPLVPTNRLPAETLEAFGAEYADWRRATSDGGLWTPPAQAAEAQAQAKRADEDAKRPGCRVAVLRVLVEGDGEPVKFDDIVTRSGYSTRMCTNVLRDLVAKGDAVQPGTGWYELTAQGRESAG